MQPYTTVSTCIGVGGEGAQRWTFDIWMLLVTVIPTYAPNLCHIHTLAISCHDVHFGGRPCVDIRARFSHPAA